MNSAVQATTAKAASAGATSRGWESAPARGAGRFNQLLFPLLRRGNECLNLFGQQDFVAVSLMTASVECDNAISTGHVGIVNTLVHMINP